MRFYPGLDPMTWLDRVPVAWVRACMRMMQRLVAEEALQRMNEVAVGTGSMGEAGPAIAQRWFDAAVPVDSRPAAPIATPDALASIGFGTVTEAPG